LLRNSPRYKNSRTRKKFDIIGVNDISLDCEKMAEELCNPGSTIEVELWNRQYAAGFKVEMLDVATRSSVTFPNELRGISISIKPRARVALLGRPDSGKSTVLQCLLRVLEPSRGRVMLSNWNATALGIQAVRSIVGIVSKDVPIIAGTWRTNLDPEGEYSDCKVWGILKTVGLMTHVRSCREGLNTTITYGGAEVSTSHRQLVGLARMLLRQPPVLLVDDNVFSATSGNLEFAEAVRHIVLTHFPMSTVIATSSSTGDVIGFDHAFFINNGAVTEHGPVEDFLSRSDLLTTVDAETVEASPLQGTDL